MMESICHLLYCPLYLLMTQPQHRLRDEPRAEGEVTRDGRRQGYKIRVIAKAFHA